MAAGNSRFVRGLKSLSIRVWRKFWADDITGRAAEMSYYFVLSIFPFLIVLAAIVGELPFTHAWRDILRWIILYLPQGSQDMVFQIVFGLTQGHRGFLSVGIFGTVLSASNGLLSLMDSLNKVYQVQETRGFFKRIGLASLMIFVLAVLLLCTFGLLTAGNWIDQWLANHVMSFFSQPMVWRIVRKVGSAAVIGVGVSILDWTMPDLRRPWLRTLPGVAFILVGWLLSGVGFNLYAEHLSTFNKTYGVLGVFVLLMVWIYILSIVVLIGAAINAEFTRLRTHRS